MSSISYQDYHDTLVTAVYDGVYIVLWDALVTLLGLDENQTINKMRPSLKWLSDYIAGSDGQDTYYKYSRGMYDFLEEHCGEDLTATSDVCTFMWYGWDF